MSLRYPTVYIGYDPREDIAYDIAAKSILKHSSIPVNIVPIKQYTLRKLGIYGRSYRVDENGQYFDLEDGRPFSTEFSFSRFLTPALNMYEGLALFIDCDMFFRGDVAELFQLASTDDTKAVWCVKHSHEAKEKTKLDNKVQQNYGRKNWSSVMLFNCEHPAHRTKFEVEDATTRTGRYLHQLSWLEDDEIGELGEEWNWLDNHSSPSIEPKNVHFTTGGPWFDESLWRPHRGIDAKYAQEWLDFYKENK